MVNVGRCVYPGFAASCQRKLEGVHELSREALRNAAQKVSYLLSYLQSANQLIVEHSFSVSHPSIIHLKLMK